MKNLNYRNKDWLEKKYLNDGWSTYRLARLFGLSRTSILRWLKKFDISRRFQNNKNNLAGQRFGRLVVIRDSGQRVKGKGSVIWECQCGCGNVTVVRGDVLTRGGTKSCGCFQRDSTRARATIHGKSNTRPYRIWLGMKARCFNEDNKDYRWYGKKGIKICDEWNNSFALFYHWGNENGYKDDLTIDRINPKGDYEPDNCRWIPWLENVSKKNNAPTKQEIQRAEISQRAQEPIQVAA